MLRHVEILGMVEMPQNIDFSDALLKEKNHTRKFWEIVATILPDYEKRKEWLKLNGNYLELE